MTFTQSTEDAGDASAEAAGSGAAAAAGSRSRSSFLGWNQKEMVMNYPLIMKPIGSMYGIFTYIWLIFMVNVGKYTSPMDPMGNVIHYELSWNLNIIQYDSICLSSIINVYESWIMNHLHLHTNWPSYCNSLFKKKVRVIRSQKLTKLWSISPTIQTIPCLSPPVLFGKYGPHHASTMASLSKTSFQVTLVEATLCFAASNVPSAVRFPSLPPSPGSFRKV